MTSLFPQQHAVDHTPDEQSVVEVASYDSVQLLGVLSSATAQAIIERLAAEPATVSAIAECVDTSLQNVQYHIRRLCAVGAVEETDTWYSERGCAMTVYGLAAEQLVVQLATTKQSTKITEERS